MKGEAIRRGQAAKGNNLAKAKQKLAARIEDYDNIKDVVVKRGMTKPGSLKVKR
jgi:3-oxoacyl-ACP reductase-like protein